ncbi:stage VI sporulation protein F [Desulfuribacillus alkaliarsenatis]|uniref:Stage VI sporulation protein F n=1 Tax=Desulfuribacillus alkaliarsenatis TaxID=766136 RepID=A0A1E5G4U3_9FIRM|nr:stage VI sporulation protein F [Desulfuribacillus alkaliarsenatis]OEF98200.1 hypothetical protein BHF68_00490 [Desulfuribacillus alkaliarsenatis]
MSKNNIFEDEKFKNFFNQHSNQLKGLAKKITPESLNNEKQLKETLKTLAQIANIKADDTKLDNIVDMLKNQKLNPKDPDSINKVLSDIKNKKK